MNTTHYWNIPIIVHTPIASNWKSGSLLRNDVSRWALKKPLTENWPLDLFFHGCFCWLKQRDPDTRNGYSLSQASLQELSASPRKNDQTFGRNKIPALRSVWTISFFCHCEFLRSTTTGHPLNLCLQIFFFIRSHSSAITEKFASIRIEIGIRRQFDKLNPIFFKKSPRAFFL